MGKKPPGGGPSPAAGTGGAEHLPSAPPARLAGAGRQLVALQAGLEPVMGKALGSPRRQRQGRRDSPPPHPHPSPSIPIPNLTLIPMRSRSRRCSLLPATHRRGSPEPLPGNASSPRSSSCFCRAPLARSHRLRPGRTPGPSRRGPRCQHAGGASDAPSILHRRQPGTAEGEEGARQVGLSGGLEL